ncbi:MAG: amidase family protein [Pseudomonadota bacterium]
MDDWLKASASAVGRGIASGAVDPVVLADAYLDAIGRHPSGPDIYARTMAERAKAEALAAKARAAAGTRRHPLDGVPVSWKDLFDTAGTATEAGSRLLEGRTPERDANVVFEAASRGVVSLGKTHMSELAFSGLGLNPVVGTPPNIHDPEALPGGSSSGAAASVAHGLAPLAIGSDTAGSVRIPAAWNDLVGLKTTHGLLPLDGVVPLSPRLDTVGPITKTVEDAALALSVMGGPAADLTDAGLKGARCLVLEGVATTELDPSVGSGFENTLARLAEAGALLEHAALDLIDEALALSAIVAPEAYAIWRETIEANPDVMFHQIRERFRGGAEMSAADYVAGWTRLDVLRRGYGAAVAGYDVVLLPTCPILPPKAATLLSDDAAYAKANLLALRNTRIANILGLCALTLPTGVPSVGVMAQMGPGRDANLLRFGAAAEQVLA